MGRVFWASGFGEDITYLRQTDPLYKKLISGYWKHLEWYTRLDAANQDLPVKTVRYQAPDDNDGMLQFYTNDARYYSKYTDHFIDNPGDEKNIYQCMIKKMGGHEDYGFGILFCVDDSGRDNINYYRLFITVEGRFALQKRLGTGWTDPLRRHLRFISTTARRFHLPTPRP
jgi:hypothetical protein